MLLAILAASQTNRVSFCVSFVTLFFLFSTLNSTQHQKNHTQNSIQISLPLNPPLINEGYVGREQFIIFEHSSMEFNSRRSSSQRQFRFYFFFRCLFAKKSSGVCAHLRQGSTKVHGFSPLSRISASFYSSLAQRLRHTAL